MGITNWEEAGSERMGHILASKGLIPTSQAAFQKEEKLITLTTYHVPETGPGNSNTAST